MSRTILVLVLLVAACGSPRQEEAAEPVDSRSAVVEAEAEAPEHSGFEAGARAATNRLQSELQQELSAAIREGGPVRAVEVCSQRAAELTAGVSERTGMQVRRVSLRHRNPDNRATTGEASVLALMAAQPALSDTMIVRDGAPLYMRAIRINTPLCLQCHGAPAQLGEGVAERLAELYPDDQGTGFTEGDLRGAFVVRPGS